MNNRLIKQHTHIGLVFVSVREKVLTAHSVAPCRHNMATSEDVFVFFVVVNLAVAR